MSQPPPAPGYGGYPPARQTSSDAIVALVLSLLSWAICPVVLAIVALVFAGKAKTAIEASNGWLDGAGMVTAAKIIAWINIGVYIIGLIFFVIIMIFASSSSVTTDFPSSTDALMLFR